MNKTKTLLWISALLLSISFLSACSADGVNNVTEASSSYLDPDPIYKMIDKD
ncbi:MAG: hypothetical protein GX116_07560 [Fibrobacter sp.]|jgi:hypothetical protein|nr:hypothetical protein [Fibrobacter sp.]